MRSALLALSLLGLTACTGPNGGDLAGRSDTRQVPSTTEPGLHISGYANIGVVRNF